MLSLVKRLGRALKRHPRVAAIVVLVAIVSTALVFSALALLEPQEPPPASAWRTDPLQALCRLAVDPAQQDPNLVSPLTPGQPAVLAELATLTPLAAREALLKDGLCHTFRSMNRDPNDPRSGFSEVWCAAPSGRVEGSAYNFDGSVVVFVAGPRMTPRPQPRAGWGCDE
jgi:hypothetical protein